MYIGVAALIYYLFFRKGNSNSMIADLEKMPGAYTGTKMNNILKLNSAMKNAGISNRIARAAILGVVGKESGFIPRWEKCYDLTSNSAIRGTFSKTRQLTDTQLTALKANCEAFFNYVYGGRYDTPINEGYKYRGSGYNQLTFKSAYRDIGNQIGVDLVNNPNANNTPEVAAKTLTQFFLNNVNSTSGKNLLRKNGYNSINDITDLGFAIKYFANVNAGLGNDINSDKVKNAALNATPFLPKIYAYTT